MSFTVKKLIFKWTYLLSEVYYEDLLYIGL